MDTRNWMSLIVVSQSIVRFIIRKTTEKEREYILRFYHQNNMRLAEIGQYKFMLEAIKENTTPRGIYLADFGVNNSKPCWLKLLYNSI